MTEGPRTAVLPRIARVDPADVTRRAGAAIGREVRELEQRPADGSSLTYTAVTHTGVRLMIKVAPPGLPPNRNRDVLRQARLLDALGEVTGVAVPELFGSDAGTPPHAPPLVVMSHTDGERYEPRHTRPRIRPAAADIWSRAIAAAQMLAALHTPAPGDLGIDEAPITLAAEIERWHRAFTARPLDRAAAQAERECRELLAATIPEPLPPAILHGDWRLGAMQCGGPEIHAVTDWETWHIGDPRLDLAWLRLMSDPAHPFAIAPAAPTLDPLELLAVYEYARGDEVARQDWFDALARYKHAALSALQVDNADRRHRTSGRTGRIRDGIPILLTAALAHLAD
ncbi:phosphotransferase [Nocardia jiangxiensis]|uniref:Phosphotransferase n=1 Tax=Nocardia jiangxiensis TaxID=282685 RepID=A0ABW6RU25_9NOCA|nr:phosphotransferase [Nocardia jiangxiensis]